MGHRWIKGNAANKFVMHAILLLGTGIVQYLCAQDQTHLIHFADGCWNAQRPSNSMLGATKTETDTMHATRRFNKAA